MCKDCASLLNAFFPFGFVIAAFHSNLRAFKIPSCKTVVPWLATKHHTAAHSLSAAAAGCGIQQEEPKERTHGSHFSNKEEEEVKQIK